MSRHSVPYSHMAYYLAFLCIFWGFEPYQTAAQVRIAGGRNTHPGDVPYHVQIRYLRQYKCGAALTIVNGLQVVVTAGSCVTAKAPGTALLPKEGFTIVGGRIRVNGAHYYEQFRCVSKIVRHADWRRGSVLVHDIAILLLDDNFDLNRLVQPVELTPFIQTKPTGTAAISGWGHTGPTAGALSRTLQLAAIATVTNADCNAAYAYTSIGANIGTRVFCLGTPRNPTYQGSCAGDEGSPAVITDNATLYLAGVYSFGTGDCGNRYQPSVFTDLSYYSSWIGKVAKHRDSTGSFGKAASPYISPRIVQGATALHRDAPYHVEIISNQNQHCSGALVSDPVHYRQIVLTAAYCVSERTPETSLTPVLRPDRLTVVAERQDRSINVSSAQFRKVRRLARHPDWFNAVARSGDIAILILDYPFEENPQVKPIDLPEGEDFYPRTDTKLTVTGWGNTTYFGTKGSAKLQIVRVPVISLPECNRVYFGRYAYDYVHDSSLCTADPGDMRGPAEGDNGAPAVVTAPEGRYLAGIFSRTERAAEIYKSHPAIFSRVIYFVPWIKQFMKSLDTPSRCEP